MSINIRAIETQLPQNRIHSTTMDKLANGFMGRIEKYTGVEYRHHISGDESVTTLGADALKKALKSANMQVGEIDLLVFSGASFDYPIPHNSAIIKALIADDQVNFHCMDINSTCLSFLNALDVVNMYLESGRYKTIALVCAEVSSRALSPHDEKVFGLFGDAAVALILEKSSENGYYQSYIDFVNYPSGALFAHVPIGGAINRGIKSSPSDVGYYFQMKGKSLFRLTTKHLDEFVVKLETQTQLKLNEFDKIITHQTSKMGNEYFISHFGIDKSKVVETLNIYGNCISASIPLGLAHYYQEEKQLKNKNILLFGSGAGVSFGALVLRFD